MAFAEKLVSYLTTWLTERAAKLVLIVPHFYLCFTRLLLRKANAGLNKMTHVASEELDCYI